MVEKTVNFLKQTFSEYYKQNKSRIAEPSRIHEREFGYWPFDGFMQRHLSVTNFSTFIDELVLKAPKGVYASCSYYDDPSLPMEDKGWNGGDLAFDIDCDDLELKCKQEHDRWLCRDCKKVGIGLRPKVCTKCKENKITVLNWSCTICLDAAKEEIIKLNDILMNDFGINKKEISIFFSGNKGYHLTVESSTYEKLDKHERREIVNYVLAKELDLKYMGFDKKTNFKDLLLRLPQSTEPGWRGRLVEFFENYDDSSLTNFSKTEKVARIYNSKNIKFNKLFEDGIKKVRSTIDPLVTSDTSRIFRLPNSLHEKSGLCKTLCNSIDSFDPYTQSVVLDNEPIKININFCPKFTLKGVSYGPYKTQTLSLPKYAGVYLMSNKLAQVA